MSFEKLSLVVDGALGLLGAEVARLGVAAAQDVHGLDAAVQQSTVSHEIYSEEPWIQGVRWRAADPASLSSDSSQSTLLARAHALVLAEVDREPEAWLAHLEQTLTVLTDPGARRPLISPLAVVIACDPAQLALGRPLLERLFQDASSMPWLRLVVACVPFALHSPGYRELDVALALVPASVASPERDQQAPLAQEPMRVELAAMALLRLAMEDERVGFFDIEQIAHIGDAMMLQ